MAKKATKKPTKRKPSSKKKTCEGKTISGIKRVIFTDVSELSTVSKGVVTTWNPDGKVFYRYDVNNIYSKYLLELFIDPKPHRAETNNNPCSSAPQQ